MGCWVASVLCCVGFAGDPWVLCLIVPMVAGWVWGCFVFGIVCFRWCCGVLLLCGCFDGVVCL